MVGLGPMVLIKGAGVAGLVTAVTLAERGATVTLLESGSRIGSGASWHAGGMLAPWCESESAPDEVIRDSLHSLHWWSEHVSSVLLNGSLVVAPARDQVELARFGRKTSHYETIGAEYLKTLEPDLAGRFDRALFFPEEGHVDPRFALNALEGRLVSLGGQILLNQSNISGQFDWIVDCTGIRAREVDRGLRGVRGEMILVRCPEVTLHRPVRLLHPRIPLYIVPRGDGVFMAGATMVESDDARQITVRAMSELLSALYVVHPAFAEAEILEANTGIRPAYADNVPRVHYAGRKISVNGMFRHGFLLSPARAAEVAEIIFQDSLLR